MFENKLGELFEKHRNGDYLNDEELDRLLTSMDKIDKELSHYGDLFALVRYYAHHTADTLREFKRSREDRRKK